MPDHPQSTPPPGPLAIDREAQCAVREIAHVLQALLERLHWIGGSLPEPPDAELMYNGAKPYSVAVDLRGAIECTVADDLQPAIRRLTKAATATEESLRRDFEERRGER